MSKFEIGIVIYIIIGFILECIAMYWHKKMFKTFYFDWEPIYIKFIQGVVSWIIVFPRCFYNYLKWKKNNKNG